MRFYGFSLSYVEERTVCFVGLILKLLVREIFPTKYLLPREFCTQKQKPYSLLQQKSSVYDIVFMTIFV